MSNSRVPLSRDSSHRKVNIVFIDWTCYLIQLVPIFAIESSVDTRKGEAAVSRFDFSWKCFSAIASNIQPPAVLFALKRHRDYPDQLKSVVCKSSNSGIYREMIYLHKE